MSSLVSTAASDLRATAAAAELPSKLFYRIGEVAGLVGVEPHVLRYWEREFRSIRPTKSAKGQRVYSRKDVENLIRVRDLLYRDRFTIAGAKQRLKRGTLDLGPEGAFLPPPSAEAPIREPAPRMADADSVTGALLRSDREPDASASEPSESVAPSAVHGVRGKLAALRAEVEAFLDELEAFR